MIQDDGEIQVDSGAFTAPYSLRSRVTDWRATTNPEERRQVAPEPNLRSSGRCRRAIPVHNTNRIRESVSRSLSRLRPGCRNRRDVVRRSGSTRSHNPSGTSHGREATSIPLSVTPDADGFANHDRVPSL